LISTSLPIVNEVPVPLSAALAGRSNLGQVALAEARGAEMAFSLAH
jgi:hypothetical protein